MTATDASGPHRCVSDTKAAWSHSRDAPALRSLTSRSEGGEAMNQKSSFSDYADKQQASRLFDHNMLFVGLLAGPANVAPDINDAVAAIDAFLRE
jgi:hypothetical protein